MSTRTVAAVLMACCSLISPADATTPRWALDPADPGPDLPAEGRSLFDSIAADGVPFPFEALLSKLERQVGCKPMQCVSSVLIPLGRSLQRASAAPDFFASPRVVVAVTGEGLGSVFAKDRLYLGYQERANLIEVISYNETAGRFEFQLVRNYRAGGTPELVYAARAVCTACHQNHAPIFSRQIWDETNANPHIAAALAAAHDRAAGARRASIHGAPVQRRVDTPNAIDDATDRANLFGVTQQIWREACDSACRARALTAALQYRLSGERGFESVPPIATGFASRWPGGLAIPNPDIPNRDPLALALALAPGAPAMVQVDIPGALEPLTPRAPLAIWNASDPTLGGRFVAGIAAQIAEVDIRELDSVLGSRARSAKRRNYSARCAMNGARYDCAGEVTLRGDASTIDELTIGGKPLRELRLNNGSVTRGGLRVRTASGDSIERVTLSASGSGGLATVTVVEDFAPARAAIAQADWPDAPFSRARMRAALGLKPHVQCCATGRLPPARDDIEPAQALVADTEAFVAPCARCHRTPERTPPNFLTGDRQRVGASLAQCAPRIFVRLAMWQTPEAERAKVPMPPPGASYQGAPQIQNRPDPAIAALQARVAAWLQAETGRPPDVAAMLARGYENLRPCLPAGT
jgi:hypothetical protein